MNISVNALNGSFHRKNLVASIAGPAVLGMIIGAFISVFVFLVKDILLFYLYDNRNVWLLFFLPSAGLLVSGLTRRFLIPSKENMLTEEYILVYHSPGRRMSFSNLFGKLASTIVTIASGGSAGLEGPSIYAGANIGEAVQHRSRKDFEGLDTHFMMIAGAAAGFAALFKAPLTSAIFIMEVPYKNGMSSRALIPSLIASASSYLTAAFLTGPDPIFLVAHKIRFDLLVLLIAPMIGIASGIFARLFVRFSEMLAAFRSSFGKHEYAFSLACGLCLGGIGLITLAVAGKPFSYGAGYTQIKFLLENNPSAVVLITLFAARMIATPLTFAGGGTGGVFFPLAVLGITVGAFFNKIAYFQDVSLYPLIRLSSFLAAGYRTPLAAVTFAAETTGNPYVLIPAMIASVISFLIMGKNGISGQQRD